MDKALIRKIIKQRKLSLCVAEKLEEAENVFLGIELMECFLSAKSILLYYSLPDELPTHKFVEKWSSIKNIYLPRVVGNDLEVAKFDDVIIPGKYGIGEPVSPSVSPSLIDLVIVPAVALDTKGNRLGRGKGYYDRLLPQCSKAYKIGVALNCQLLPAVPVEPFDVTLDAVLTASNKIIIK
mgnify:CR=1 FL=1